MHCQTDSRRPGDTHSLTHHIMPVERFIAFNQSNLTMIEIWTESISSHPLISHKERVSQSTLIIFN